MTAVIAVAATMVRLAVAVSVDCTWEVAVIVTTLLVGTVAGAVYSPLVYNRAIAGSTDGPIHKSAAGIQDGGRALRGAEHGHVRPVLRGYARNRDRRSHSRRGANRRNSESPAPRSARKKKRTRSQRTLSTPQVEIWFKH